MNNENVYDYNDKNRNKEENNNLFYNSYDNNLTENNNNPPNPDDKIDIDSLDNENSCGEESDYNQLLEPFIIQDKNTGDTTSPKNYNEINKKKVNNIPNNAIKNEEIQEKKKELIIEINENQVFDDEKNNIINSNYPEYNKKVINRLSIKNKNVSEKNLNKDDNFSLKKRKRDKEPEDLQEDEIIESQKENDPNNGIHSKNSEDNILKKIRGKFMRSLIIFINLFLNSFLGNKKEQYVTILRNNKKQNNNVNYLKKDLIKNLDYSKYINQTKTRKNLDLLKMPLKDILSLKITSKYKSLKRYSNKIIINEIIKNESENKIIFSVLNDLTLENYLDIFTSKKELRDFLSLNEEEYKQIMDIYPKADKLLKKIHESNDENYYSKFKNLLYNYKEILSNKKGRKRIKKNKKK